MATLVYLLGASHSGSTLLGMLLGAQPGCCTVGELKATSLGNADAYKCSCKRRIRECEFWDRIAMAMDKRGVRGFDIANAGTSIDVVDSAYVRRLLAPLYRGGAWESLRDLCLGFSSYWKKHLKETNHRNAALIESVLAVNNAQVVIDSSKVALRLKYLLKIPGLDVRVIRVIRDGRAVSMTYMDDWNFADASDPSLRGGGSGSKRPPPRRSMAEAANEWKRSQEAGECLAARLPRSQWTQVRYEELCADPESALRRLNAFMGLDSDDLVLDFRSRGQHVIGNGMRFDTTSEIRLDERWKTNLSAEDLAAFDRVAGNLNRRYGYP